jgi:hypothetical protein
MTAKKKTAESCVYQKEVFEDLFGTLGHDLKRKEKLAPHTTLGIGGEAEFFYVARRSEDLVRAIQAAKDAGIPVYV